MTEMRCHMNSLWSSSKVILDRHSPWGPCLAHLHAPWPRWRPPLFWSFLMFVKKLALYCSCQDPLAMLTNEQYWAAPGGLPLELTMDSKKFGWFQMANFFCRFVIQFIHVFHSRDGSDFSLWKNHFQRGDGCNVYAISTETEPHSPIVLSRNECSHTRETADDGWLAARRPKLLWLSSCCKHHLLK